MFKIFFSLFIFLALYQNAYALDVNSSTAESVNVNSAKIQMLEHKSILFGLSCKSGPVGEINNLENINIGDTINLNGRSIHVGLIEVTEFLEDSKYSNKKKGDVDCAVASDKKSLPYEKDCNALWLYIENCKPQ